MIGTPITAARNAFPLGSLGRQVEGAPGASQLSNALDATGFVAQQSTISAAGANNNATYSVRVVSTGLGVDETVSFLTDGTATDVELTAGLLAAMQANGAISTAFEVSSPTTTSILLQGTPGADYAFAVTFPANPGTQLSVATGQNAADGGTYRLGRALELVGASASVQTAQSTCRPIAAANFGTERGDFTVTFDAAGTYATGFQIRNLQTGEIRSVQILTPAGADLPTTLTDIQTAIEGVVGTSLPSGTVVTVASPDVQVALPPGWVYLIPATEALAFGGAADLTFAVGVFGMVVAASIALVRDPRDRAPIRGVANDDTTIEAGRAVPYVAKGNGGLWCCALADGETVTPGDDVYIETAAGDDLGALRATQTATSVQAPGWEFRRADPHDAGQAIVFIP